MEPGDTKTRQFFWGLSNGIFTLTASGAFWLLLGASHAAVRPSANGWADLGAEAALIALPALALTLGGLAVRRKAAGFSRGDLSRPDLRAGARAIERRFRWISAAQGVLCALAGAAGAAFHREDLIWPGIALVVSLHFVPLGLMFRMRPYLIAAAAGTLVALSALGLPPAVLSPDARFVVVGVGMGAVVWTTALEAIWRADQLARTWAEKVSSS